jgi:hypothetical protein
VKKIAIMYFAALLVSGCGPTAEEYGSPDVELIRDPKLAYRLDFKFHDVPGPVTKVKADAFYDTRIGEGCVRALTGSGAIVTPRHKIILPLQKITENHYQAIFHHDAIRDEDYFGYGICKWRFQNIRIEFSSPNTNFIIAGLINETKRPETKAIEDHFFLHRDYFKDPAILDYVVGKKPEFYLPEMGPQFRLTVSAERI